MNLTQKIGNPPATN